MSEGREVGLRRLAATALGLGLLRPAPGTVASAAALAVGLVVGALAGGAAPVVLGAMVVASSALGFALAGWAEREAGGSDPQWFVLDEVAGMWLAMWALPGGWVAAAAAFVLFRVLDIAKPPPIRQTERLLGSAGIMLDDLTAGVLANVILRLLWWRLG